MVHPNGSDSLPCQFSSALILLLKGDPDTYWVNTRDQNAVRDQVVTFVDHSNNDPPIEPPDVQLLAIYAAFSQVFHACGAAEYVDDIWRGPSTGKQLNSKGSSDVTTLIYDTFAYSHPYIAVG